MDSQGKPEMSRELVERLMRNPQQGGESAYGHKVWGPAPTPSDRVRQRKYRDSMLGSGHSLRQFGAEIGLVDRRSNHRKAKKDASPDGRVSTGQNRPSSGFQEPTRRGYDPYSR
ncbi:hypothetical protein B7Y94_04760 [Candidatus Saccharibacteria bacterium 32-49-12]|nr:MAG: hypothetical protein B7Y94_04760 [Candidatus Saccharibacteria bacterium 32-49-12]